MTSLKAEASQKNIEKGNSRRVKFAKKTVEGVKGFFTVSPDLCKGCGLCIEKCPSHVIDWSDELGVYGTPIIQAKHIDNCTACKICQWICPDAAIDIVKKKDLKKAASKEAARLQGV